MSIIDNFLLLPDFFAQRIVFWSGTKPSQAWGFQPNLWNHITSQLQLKLPDHFPDDPYKLNGIHKATCYVLHGTPLTILTTAIQTVSTLAPLVASPTPTETPIKNKKILQLVKRMIESFMKAVPSQNSEWTNLGDQPLRWPGCHFCGSLEHFVSDCQVVLDYICMGKCNHDINNRIILPTGVFIPHNIPWALFKDCLDEWHRLNPNQPAARQLMLGVISNTTSEPPASASLTLMTRHTHPNLLDASLTPSTQLTADTHPISLYTKTQLISHFTDLSNTSDTSNYQFLIVDLPKHIWMVLSHFWINYTLVNG